jgi:hypothetical protein
MKPKVFFACMIEALEMIIEDKIVLIGCKNCNFIGKVNKYLIYFKGDFTKL